MKRIVAALLLSASSAWAVCPGPGRSCSSEAVCSRADIIFCEDWEAQVTPTGGTLTGWEWNPGWNSCTSITGSGGYNSSSNALKQTISSSKAECGFPGTTGISQSVQTDPIFMRFYVKFSSGYKFMCSNAQKLAYLRAVVGDNSVWRNMLGLQAKDQGGGDGYNTCNDSTQGKLVMDDGLHNIVGSYNGTATHYLSSNTWYCIEWEMRANTPGSSNGYFNMWVDDVAYMSYTSVNLQSTGAALTMTPYLSHYYGGNPSPTHPTQDLWYDNIVAARARIGCFGSQPASPTIPHRVIAVN